MYKKQIKTCYNELGSIVKKSPGKSVSYNFRPYDENITWHPIQPVKVPGRLDYVGFNLDYSSLHAG